MPNRLDSILSQGFGKAKGLKARLTGLVGVFEVIAEQHGEVTALMERARTSDEKFTELWPTIKRELLSHEKAETQEVFPPIRANEATRALAERHDAEAVALETLIGQVDQLAIGSQARKDTYQRLIDTVLHHAKEEEKDIFPKAQEALGKPRIEALEAPFLAAKKQIAEGL